LGSESAGDLDSSKAWRDFLARFPDEQLSGGSAGGGPGFCSGKTSAERPCRARSTRILPAKGGDFADWPAEFPLRHADAVRREDELFS
ncbi:unnamed protein product, partial [Polarella glacialis]